MLNIDINFHISYLLSIIPPRPISRVLYTVLHIVIIILELHLLACGY